MKVTLLLLTELRRVWRRPFLEWRPIFIMLAASATGLLSGSTMVGFRLSWIQCLTWSMESTAPTASCSQGVHVAMYLGSLALAYCTGSHVFFPPEIRWV